MTVRTDSTPPLVDREKRLMKVPRKPGIILPDEVKYKRKMFNFRCRQIDIDAFKAEASALEVSVGKLLMIAFNVFQELPERTKIEMYHRITGVQVKRYEEVQKGGQS